MRVVGVDTITVSLPTRRVHAWAGLSTAIGRDYVLVRVRSDEGLEGWGEAPVLKDWGGDHGRYFGESPQTTIAVVRDYLAPGLEGADPLALEGAYARLDRAVRGYPYAKAAVDVALHDLAGRALGVPVYQLLGGLYRTRIPVAHSIGLMEIADAVKEAAQAVDEGIRTIKLKIGQDPARDVELVRQVRQAIGDGVAIRVDANQGYATAKIGLKVTRQMEQYGIWFMEQPCEGIAALARIAQAVDTPIMADESAWTARDVLALHDAGAAEMISLYYTKPGGLLRAKRLAAVAEAAGMACDVNGSMEMGIGNTANLHLAAATPVISIPGSITINQPAEQPVTRIAGHFYLDDIIQAPLRYVDGCLEVPDGPGLGVEIDPAKLDKYRTG
jgi:muconate cycloisomerase